jgi:hypothetical protein
MAGKPSFPDEHLLLGKHMGKDVFCPLPELEALLDMQEQRWYECLRLLATRFPDGFEGSPFNMCPYLVLNCHLV